MFVSSRFTQVYRGDLDLRVDGVFQNVNAFLIEHGLHVYRFNRVDFFERVIADQVCRVRVAVACRNPGVLFPVMKRDGLKTGLSGIVHEINIEPTFCQVVEIFGDERDVKGIGRFHDHVFLSGCGCGGNRFCRVTVGMNDH